MAAQSEDDENGAETSDNPPIPTDLQIEYASDPIGIDVRNPRLSWIVDAPGRDWEQSAYQILVASSPSKLNEDEVDIWDSGTVNSSRSVNIEYNGPELESKTSYHWKVRTYNDEGEPSPWSDPAYWETGLLDEDDWDAEWIEYTDNSERTGLDWTNYTYEANFEIVSENAGFVFRAQDSDNLYMWQIIGTDPDNPVLRPHVRENGYWDYDDVPIGDALDNVIGTQHKIKIEIIDDEFTTYIDGIEVDTRTDSTFSSGTIGFREDPSERAQFDNVLVTTPDETTLYEDDFSNPDESLFPESLIDDGVLDVDGGGPLLLDESQYQYPSPLLRTETELDSEIERARAHVAGLGFHELYINGERVGDQVLHPGRTNTAKTVLYETYDVTDHLTDGTNALGVMLGRARHGELAGDWGWDDVSWWSHPELLFRLDVEFADGSVDTIVSDKEWSATDGPIRRDSLFDGEVYDAREERSGWTEPGFEDASWNSVNLAEGPAGDLTNQLVQPIKETRVVEPVEVTEPEPDVYVFDFGEMLTGWPELTVEGAEGTQVTIRSAEKLEGFPEERTGTIDDQPGVSQYTLNGEGAETYEPRFTYYGFRYIQIEGYPGEPTLDDIVGKNVHTAVDEDSQSSFACSNDLLNQIHQNTQRSLLNNLHSVPTDTPVFEKMAYGGDGLAMAETTIYNYPSARFFRKWMRDFADCQVDGAVPDIAPYDGRRGTAAGWGSAFVIIPWWMYTYYGDTRILEEHYEEMKAYLNVLEEQTDELIHPGGYGDYNAPGTFGHPPEGSEIVGTSYFYRDAEILSEVASLLGNEENAETFAVLAEAIKDAFNDEFLDEDELIYRTGETDEYRQTSNLLPLAFEMVPEKHLDDVVENLVHDVMERRNGHLNTGCHGTKWLLQVLTEYGHHDAAYTIATQTDYPSWGHWIDNGFTGLLEDWDIEWATRSLNHQYFGAIDEWFYKYLAGIRMPTDPGFERVRIAPEPVPDLDWAEATVETVRGIVDVRWERRETSGQARTIDGLALSTTIPGNSTGVVEIPMMDGDTVRVRENGKTIWNNGNRTRPNHPGIEDIEQTDDHVVVKVTSGEYEFELEQIGN